MEADDVGTNQQSQDEVQDQVQAKKKIERGGKIQKWGGALEPGQIGEDCFQSIGTYKNFTEKYGFQIKATSTIIWIGRDLLPTIVNGWSIPFY